MRKKLGTLFWVEFMREIECRVLIDLSTVHTSKFAFLLEELAQVFKYFFTCSRALLKRDITVPIGTDNVSAVSLQVNPSITVRSNTTRYSGNKRSMARTTSTVSRCGARDHSTGAVRSSFNSTESLSRSELFRDVLHWLRRIFTSQALMFVPG